MNKLIFILLLCGLSTTANCQTIPSNNDSIKQQRRLNTKEQRKLEKYVEGLLKEGWRSCNTASLYKQFDGKNKYQQEKDSLGRPVWQFGKGDCIGSNFDSSMKRAIELAQNDAVAKFLSTKLLDNKRNLNIKPTHFDSVLNLYNTRPNGSIEVWVEVAIPIMKLEEQYELAQE